MQPTHLIGIGIPGISFNSDFILYFLSCLIGFEIARIIKTYWLLKRSIKINFKKSI